MARAVALPSCVVVVLLVVLAGCGGGGARTQLTMLAINDNVGRAVFHLRCGPAGGDLPSATKACAALGRNPSLVTKPKPFVCGGGPVSWWDVTVEGRFQGKLISRRFSTCWTPQMAMIGRLRLSWDELRAHLVKRRRAAVLPGTARSFPPKALREADLVTCDIGDHQLELGIPARGESTEGFDAGVASVASVTLSVSRNSDGSVRASCHFGKS